VSVVSSFEHSDICKKDAWKIPPEVVYFPTMISNTFDTP